MKHILLSATILFVAINASLAQNVGINKSGTTPNPSAILDLNTGNTFSSGNSKGLLIPNIALTSTTDATTISAPAVSLLVYVPAGGAIATGYYYNSGTTSSPIWKQIGTGSAIKDSAWTLFGNSGTTYGTNYIGTNDDKGLMLKVNGNVAGRIEDATSGASNSALGYQALASNTTGADNNALGFEALNTNTTGSFCTAVGDFALQKSNIPTPFVGVNLGIGFEATQNTTSGFNDFAIGFQALQSNTTSINNTAVGEQALQNLNGGEQNTAIGQGAMQQGTTGSWNTALGINALLRYTTGSQNVQVGAYPHTTTPTATASNNTSVGFLSLQNASTGGNNTAIGAESMQTTTTGVSNVSLGTVSLAVNAAGSSNTAIGTSSLFNSTASQNVAVGDSAMISNVTGTGNTALGYQADASTNNLTNATVIGNGAVVAASNNMMFGNTSVVGWGFGATPTAGVQALVVGTTGGANGDGACLTTGGIWANASDSTKKFHIKPISYGLQEVMKLRPVRYQMKGSGYHDIGFLAQEVKLVLPEIVYGEEGHMTLSYGQVTPVLVKAMQEQQQVIEKQQATIDNLTATNKTTQAKVDKLQEDMATLKNLFLATAKQQQASIK